MNIKEFLNSPGITIKNPNKKSKKDKQPPTITLPFNRDNTSSIYSQANEQFDDVGNMLTDIEDPFKYENQGITLTRKGTELRPGTEFRNLDFELADAQSNWTKAGNAVLQTVVDEIIGGTIQGFSDMTVGVPQGLAKLTDAILDKVFDIKGDKVQDALGMKDEDYSNPVSAKIQEWRDKFSNEVAPIYTTPGVDISNGGFGNFGWWMSNMPSIMSSITLMIPTRAATIGIGKLASLIGKANTARKAARLINKAEQAEKLADATKLGQVSRDFKELNAVERFINNPITRERVAKSVRDFAEAGLMRTIENYQEAHQSYQDMYAQASQALNEMSDEDYSKWLQIHGEEFREDGIDTNDKNAVAKHIATKAADRTFAADYSNMIFDFIQLHALRDVGKLAKNVTSPSVKRMHRMSKAITGKSDKEISEIAKKSFGTKLRENLTDFTTGAAKSILSEASEGVEEGINYIASQEGITYGNTLLSLEKDSTKGGFWNTRLSDYLDDSEFWESAFWGVAGGVVFGEGMNAYNRARIANANKKAQKRREENQKTGEQIATNLSTNVLDNFISLGETYEVKAAKESIQRRAKRAQQLQDDIKLIKDGRNPNIRDPKTGEAVELGDDPVSKEIAKQEVIDDFITDCAFDAINSGTYDLLVDYLKDDNVKKMFVDSGATTSDEMENFVNNVISRMEIIKDAYYKELSHVNHQVTAMNANKPEEGKIPLEYVNHIARINAQKQAKIAGLDKRIQGLLAKEPEVNVDGTEYAGNVVDAKGAVRVAMLLNAYGQLEADKKAVQNDSELEEWAKAESLAEIKNQQDAMLQTIVETGTMMYGGAPLTTNINDDTYKPTEQEHGLGVALRAIRLAKTYKKLGDGVYDADYSSPDYQKSDEELMQEYEHVFSKSKTNVNVLSQISELVESDLNDVAGTQDGSLFNTNKRLYDLYTNLADLEIQRAALKSQISHSQSQIQEHVDIIHNRLNNVRKKKLEIARKTITDIHTKYINTNAKDVEMAVISAFMNDRAEATHIARENLTGVDQDGHSDADKLIDALSIINFSSGSNQEAFTYIMRVLRGNAQKYRSTGEISTTFREPLPAPQPSQPTTSSTEPQNSLFGQPTAQINDTKTQNILVSPDTINDDARPKRNVVINIENGKVRITPLDVTDNNPNAIPLLDNGNGEFELAISALPKEQQTQYLLNPGIFSPINADTLQQNVDVNITSNPIVVYDAFNKPVIDTLGGAIAVNTESGEVIDNNTPPVERIDDNAQAPTPEGQQTENADEAPAQQPIPSTGGVVEHYSRQQQDNLVQYLISDYMNENNFDIDTFNDWNGLASTLRDKLQPGIDGGNYTAEEIELAINEYINDLKDDSDQIQQLSGDDRNAGVVAMYARYEEPDMRDLSGLFKASVEAFINEFSKHYVIKEIDGKPAIRIRDILNACTKLKNNMDDTAVNNLYKAVTSYLMSDEGQAKYKILDAADVANGNVLSKVGKTAKELREESGETIVTENDVKLDLTNILRHGDSNSLNTLRALKVGDSLSISFRPTGYARKGQVNGVLEFKAADGTIIGILHMPMQPDPNSRGGLQYYRYHTGDWMMDVALNANGQPVGKLYDIFQSIFFDSNTDYEDIRKIIVEYNDTGNDILCGGKLSQNPIIQQLVKDSAALVSAKNYDDNVIYINRQTGQPDYAKLIHHLWQVWAYTYNNGGDVVEMKDNLRDWFVKAYNTYKSTLEAYRNLNNTTAEVSDNPDGDVVLVVPKYEEDREDAYDKMPLVGDAIASPGNAFVGIADKDNTLGLRIITASDKVNPRSTRGWTNNSTVLTIIGNSGKPQFVKAFGVRLNDNNISDDAKNSFSDIMGAYNTIVRSYFDAIANAKTQAEAETARVKLKEFLTDTISGRRVGLFRAVDGQVIIDDVNYKDKPLVRGIEINWLRRDGSKQSFQITVTDRNGVPKLGIKRITDGSFKVSDANTAHQALVYGFLSPNFQFDVSKEAIKADALLGGQQRNKVFRRTDDNKLRVVLTHPSTNEVLYDKTYNSYSDFLIENNMLRVNTKKIPNRGVDSNFGETTKNQRGNQRVMVKLKTKTQIVQAQQPNVSETQTSIISKDADEETFNKIKELLPERSQVFGQTGVDLSNLTGKVPDILKTVFNVGAVDEFNRVVSELGIDVSIFPENIMYDPLFNRNTGDEEGDGFIAATNTKQKDVRYTQYGDRREEHNRARLKPGWVVIGNKLLNMLSSTSKERRNRGVTKLIHERLHQLVNDPNITSDKAEAFKAIKELYNIYRAQLSADIAIARRNGQNTRLKALNNLNKLLANVTTNVAAHPERENDIYEEFMVEAMTNELMYSYLNKIPYNPGDNEILDKYNSNSGKETLFTKLMDLIARIFGWNKRVDNTLNDKFYQILRTFGNSNHIEVEPSENPVTPVVNQDNSDNNDNESQNDQNQSEGQNEDDNNDEGDIFSDDSEEAFDDDDSTMFGEDDTDEPPFASVEELSPDMLDDGITGLDVLRNRLPIELQENFDKLKNNGYIELICK